MKTILHCDANNFYASVACKLDPSLQGKCVAVCGDPDKRHGIILAKNEMAKKYGIKTGDVIWQALNKCPQLVLCAPEYDQYVKYSNLLFDIYSEYTDRVEPFGIDECWLDVSESVNLFGNGENIANTLRERVKNELGITISVGVSFNKIFAKLGSDMKKPDATTIINTENYKSKVWNLPVSDMLMIGRRTAKHLASIGIDTIGDLATTNTQVLKDHFGINGIKYYEYANGICDEQVKFCYDKHIPKSIGNSTTMPKDITTIKQATSVIMALSEMVAIRLRRYNFYAGGVSFGVKSNNLEYLSKQKKLDTPISNAGQICDEVLPIYDSLSKQLGRPIRAISVSVYDLQDSDSNIQMSLFDDAIRQEKLKKFDQCIDKLRLKYGYGVIKSASIMSNEYICQDLEETDFQPFKK